MEKQILDLLINMDKKFTKINERFDQIDKRFEQIDARLDQIDKRFEQIDARLDQMDKRFEQIDARLDQMDNKIDRAFTEIVEVKKTQIEMFAAMRGGFLEQDRKIEELIA